MKKESLKLSNYYDFNVPVKIISGLNSLENIPFEMAKHEMKKPLIITDEGIKQSGILKKVLDIFERNDIICEIVFDETPRDSSLEAVGKAADLYWKNSCNGIVAVGGGSVIDTAKGVKIAVAAQSTDLSKLAGVDRIPVTHLPLFILPTTSGTGSEATQAAVITDTAKKEKMLFISPQLYPTVAVLDPRLTLTLPPKLTAMTGMDALAHAVEAYSCKQKNPLSDAFAISAVSMIFNSLVKAVKDGSDKKARLELANASLLAGIAFSNSMVGAVHSIGHACGAVAHVPHGFAMSVLLPLVMEFNREKAGEYFGELLLYAEGAEKYSACLPENRCSEMIQAVINLKKELYDLCGLGEYFTEKEVSSDLFEEIAEYAVNDGSVICNPVELTREDAVNILKNAVIVNRKAIA